mmetsp:Transcript_5591/g.8304  ORF Transcript_5591/g.8304 Transcript_5591/m.8304 type:complete len:377 (-) Transcript_5591:49-1179(-)
MDVSSVEPNINDPRLPHRADDPRKFDKTISRSGYSREKALQGKGRGRNTESFDPKSTLVRPDMRIIIGPRDVEVYNKGMLRHDDVVVVPEFFCKEDDWNIYYSLVEEIRAAQSNGVKKSDWISWHEGAHLITQNPSTSKTFAMIQRRISRYFNINNSKVGTRFNWYRDASDWKPFHHDSAAFNASRAENQNITVGVSFGASRELAFLHAANGTRLYFPQTNGMMFSFGRDVNIQWKHGINALPDAEQARDNRGRISIILWGLCPDSMVRDEPDSPAMLSDDSRGPGYSMHHKTDHKQRIEQRVDGASVVGQPSGPESVLEVSQAGPQPAVRDAAFFRLQQHLRAPGSHPGRQREDRKGQRRGAHRRVVAQVTPKEP